MAILRGLSTLLRSSTASLRDFYWYSPVLKKLLDDKRGDVVVQPVNDEEVRRVLAYCYEQEDSGHRSWSGNRQLRAVRSA